MIDQLTISQESKKMIIKFIAKKKSKDPDELLRDYDFTTRTAIASCSKWFSVALLMTFVDEGKLSRNDTIGNFLPVMAIHENGNITIWECPSHLIAINRRNIKESRGMITHGYSMDAIMEKIGEQPIEGKPGKVFHYRNIGLQIAAAVIAKISGEDFKILFREKIAIPCDMKNTDFGNGNIASAAGGAFSTP